MRTSNWTVLSALALALTVTACGDDKNDDDTSTTTPMTTTDPSTGPVDPSTGPVDPTTGPVDPTTGPVDPTTGPVDPTTGPVDPTTTDPATTDPDTTTGGPLSCENYCAVYMTACKDFSEYDNEEACLDQCKQWPVGEAGAVTGDSLGCRDYHVNVANMVDPMVHCPHAGPNGAGECVDPNAPTCEGYCAVYFMNCKDDLNLYNDMDDCMTQCAPWYPGVKGDTAGNSIGCRDYHAGVALGDPDLHCPHAGPGGADVCVFAP